MATPSTIKDARTWGRSGFVALVSGAIGEANPELVSASSDFLGKKGERFGEEYHQAGGTWEPEDFRDFCLHRVAGENTPSTLPGVA